MFASQRCAVHADPSRVFRDHSDCHNSIVEYWTAEGRDGFIFGDVREFGTLLRFCHLIVRVNRSFSTLLSKDQNITHSLYYALLLYFLHPFICVLAMITALFPIPSLALFRAKRRLKSMVRCTTGLINSFVLGFANQDVAVTDIPQLLNQLDQCLTVRCRSTSQINADGVILNRRCPPFTLQS